MRSPVRISASSDSIAWVELTFDTRQGARERELGPRDGRTGLIANAARLNQAPEAGLRAAGRSPAGRGPGAGRSPTPDRRSEAGHNPAADRNPEAGHSRAADRSPAADRSRAAAGRRPWARRSAGNGRGRTGRP